MFEFEEWFNRNFAWFFTNGMKEIQDHTRTGMDS